MKFGRTALGHHNSDKPRSARLFVIATEGAVTEPTYFKGLQARGVVDRTRVRVEVLPATDGLSAPAHVLARLDELASRYALQSFDECWIVVDFDRGRAPQLAAVDQVAKQKRFKLAVSNPCFEVWLVLHEREPSALATVTSSQQAKSAWGEVHTKVDSHLTREKVVAAITRARALDPSEEERGWPQTMGTRVHRLASSLLGMSP